MYLPRAIAILHVIIMHYVIVMLHNLSRGNALYNCAADTLRDGVSWGGFWPRERGWGPGTTPKAKNHPNLPHYAAHYKHCHGREHGALHEVLP